MINEISIDLTPEFSLSIISTAIFLICLAGVWFAHIGELQRSIFIIGLVVLLRLPFPLEIHPITSEQADK